MLSFRLVLAAALVGFLWQGVARAAENEGGLWRFVPENANVVLYVQNADKLGEVYGKGQVGRSWAHEEMKPVAELLGSFPKDVENYLSVVAALDLPKLLPLVKGDLLVLNTHFGPMPDLGMENHYDTIIIFEHDNKIDRIRELFEGGMREVPESAKKERERIGEFEMRRTSYAMELQVASDYRPNPAHDPNNPDSEEYEVVYEPFSAPLDYQYVLTDKLAMFAEGSNTPLRQLLSTAARGRAQMIAHPSFEVMRKRLGIRQKFPQGITLLARPDLLIASIRSSDNSLQASLPGKELGFERVSLLAANFEVKDANDTLRLAVVHEAGKPPLPVLLDTLGKADLASFDLISEEADAAYVWRLDAGAAIKAGIEAMREAKSPAAQYVEQGVAFAKAQAGIDPLDEVFYRLGQSHFSARYEPDLAAKRDRHSVLGLGVADSAAMAATFKRLIQQVGEKAPFLASYYEVQEVNGREAVTISAPDATVPSGKRVLLAFAVGKAHLVFANNASSLTAALQQESSTGGDGSFGRSKEFRRAKRELPDDAFALGVTKRSVATQSELRQAAYQFLVWFYGMNDEWDEAIMKTAQALSEKTVDAEEKIALSIDEVAVIFARKFDDAVVLEARYLPKSGQ